MLTPSPEMIQLRTTFAVGMTAPTCAKALVFMYGALLTPGRRTIAAALRVQGLDGPDTRPWARRDTGVAACSAG